MARRLVSFGKQTRRIAGRDRIVRRNRRCAGGGPPVPECLHAEKQRERVAEHEQRAVVHTFDFSCRIITLEHCRSNMKGFYHHRKHHPAEPMEERGAPRDDASLSLALYLYQIQSVITSRQPSSKERLWYKVYLIQSGHLGC